jgi:hypothetical protein
MGSRGPDYGSGEITAWVGEQLKIGPKSAHEIQLGSRISMQQIRDVLARWRQAGLILELPKERRGAGGRLATIFQLKPGAKLADAPTPRSRHAEPFRYDLRPVRAIEDAFHAIVHARRAPPP